LRAWEVSGLNILIVDDSATIRERLLEMLSILPGVHRVDTAATPSDARQRLEAAPPDVVVLDIHLPGGSGLEVLDALRPARDRVTVIVLTNDPTPQARDMYQRAGADFFLDKSAEFQLSVDIIAGLAQSRISLSNQLLLTEEALRASETRCRELFDNATDAIFTTSTRAPPPNGPDSCKGITSC
jgi:DNA-binding NarL/FixJ family response regulator